MAQISILANVLLRFVIGYILIGFVDIDPNSAMGLWPFECHVDQRSITRKIGIPFWTEAAFQTS